MYFLWGIGGEIFLIYFVIVKIFLLINFDMWLFYFGCNVKIKFIRIRIERICFLCCIGLFFEDFV